MSERCSKARVLKVMVSGWVIEDGSLTPPTVGSPLEVALEFFDDNADPDNTALRALAEPVTGRRPAPDHNNKLRWQTKLRGDGWNAAWSADRPHIGSVELQGRLVVDYIGHSTEPVRGLVTRVQVVTTTMVLKPRGWASVPGQANSLTDVQQSPRWFNMDDPPAVAAHGASRQYQLGVLVDLDLDAIGPAPLRPSIVPAAVAAHGDVLWVMDRELPILVRIDDPDAAPSATEFVLDAPVVATLSDPRPRRLIADDGGCWVVGGADILWCAVDSTGEPSVQRYDLGTVTAAGAVRGRLLVATDTGLHLIDAGTGEQREIDTAQDTGRVVDIDTAPGCFVVLTRPSDAGAPNLVAVYRLLFVDFTGAVRSSPTVEAFRPKLVATGTDGARVAHRDSVIEVTVQRGVESVVSLPRASLDVGRAGDDMWCTIHRPDGSGPSGFWPVRDATELPPIEDGRWLFVVLDPATLKVRWVRPIRTTRPDVTVDDRGSVWLATGFELRRISDPDPDTTLDVATLLR